MNEEIPTGGLPPLDVKCTDSDCESDLHCFKYQSRRAVPMKKGACRSCGVELISWDRLHACDISDVANTFAALEHELIRHHFWHKPIDQDADLHARRKGMVKMRDAVTSRIRSSVGGAAPFRDGQQTPMKGNVIYFAQHATASCCRTCMEYWHGIPKGRPLSETELDYFTKLAILYIQKRMPHLRDDPEKIPRTRRLRPATK